VNLLEAGEQLKKQPPFHVKAFDQLDFIEGENRSRLSCLSRQKNEHRAVWYFGISVFSLPLNHP
jgi:hypothetical protein